MFENSYQSNSIDWLAFQLKSHLSLRVEKSGILGTPKIRASLNVPIFMSPNGIRKIR